MRRHYRGGASLSLGAAPACVRGGDDWTRITRHWAGKTIPYNVVQLFFKRHMSGRM